MALLAAGTRRWGYWWTLCLVGVTLLSRDARAQNPDNNTSPCSHFKSVRHVEVFGLLHQNTRMPMPMAPYANAIATP